MVSPIGTQAALAAEPLERKGPRLGGIGVDGAIPFVSSGGVRVLTEAICYRVFKRIAQDIAPECFSAMSRIMALDEVLGPLLSAEHVPMDTWTWLRSIAGSRRRKALIKAWREFEERYGPHAEWDTIKAFVKSELLAYFAGTPDGPDKEKVRYVARLIQAPHDDTHLVAGPYFKPLVGGWGQTGLKEVWHDEHWIFYASVPPSKLNKWLHRVKGAVSWFWSDYSAFDATYSAEAWAVLESLYLRCYPTASKWFREVLDIWRKPHGKIRLRKEEVVVEYWAGVCNASGRDDTALANALLNGLVLAMSFASALTGTPLENLTEREMVIASELVDIAIVGDDSLVACRFDVTKYSALLEANIARFGLTAKVEHSDNLCDVTFLGMMPYLAAGQLTWGPTIGRRLYKAFWQREPDGNLGAWVKGVAQQLSMFRNVPLLYEVADQTLNLLHGHKVTPVIADENRAWTNVDVEMPQWDASTMDWLCRRYSGLTPQLIERDVKTIRSIKRLPAIVRLESLEIILSQDDL